MRTKTTEDYSMMYPDIMAYSGQTALVRLTSLSAEATSVSLSISIGGTTYTEQRTPINGAVTFDIARYMRLGFTRASVEYELTVTTPRLAPASTSHTVTCGVSITYSGESVVHAGNFDIIALYGTLGLGRSNGGTRRRTWFVNYPFSLDLYVTDTSAITLEYGDGTSEVFSNTATASPQHVTVDMRAENLDVPPQAHKARLVATNTQYLNNALSGASSAVRSGSTTYELDIDRSSCGTLLRWIDDVGQWAYYLLRATGRSYNVAQAQSWEVGGLVQSIGAERNVMNTVGSLAQQQLNATETVSLGAKLVDGDTLDLLLTLAASPVVEALVYKNADDSVWERVAVTAASYTRTNDNLQDFTVAVQRATTMTQML